MLPEKQIRTMYDTAVDTLKRCSIERTIDPRESDAAMTEKILGRVLQVPSQEFRKKKTR